jgi:hypothetical protein
VEVVLSSFLSALQLPEEDVVAIKSCVARWANKSFVRTVSHVCCKHKAMMEKKEKHKQEIAKNNAKFDGLSTEQILSTGLLESAHILLSRGLAEDDAILAKHSVPTKISSGTTIGHLLKRNPDVASRFNLKVVESLSAKPVLTQAASRAPSVSSFASARSQKSRRSVASRKSSTSRSLSSRSRPRSSSSRRSFSKQSVQSGSSSFRPRASRSTSRSR